MKVWAAWLGLAMALSVGLAGCSNNNTTAVTLSISPTSATVLLGTSIQFLPSEAGSQNGIQWSVDGINNGNATVGTIDSTGLYTAPEMLPVPPSGVVVPVLYCEPNAGIPGSGSTGSIIELQSGFNFTNFAVGNTITITGNSVPGWDTSFVIVASGPLANGNFGVQIATPAGPPTVGTGGSATVTPGVTIGAQVEQTSVVATATITLDSGIRVSLSQTSFTIGTNEQFLFSNSNAFGPTVIVTGTSNQAVAWSVTSGGGTIDPNSGLYTAPSTPGTATVTVTSLADNTQFASATVNIVTAVDPAVTSISPPNGAIGAAFQEVFITGTNFISTTNVFVNGSGLPGPGTPLPSGALFAITPTTLFVIVPDSVLSSNPVSGSTAPLTFTVSRQNGVQQSCSPLPCQLVLSPVRPAIVASKPDSVQASSVSGAAITLDGGYFGTTNTTLGFQGNPVVNVQFAGRGTGFTFNSDRELLVTATPGTVSVPGLYPITLINSVSCPVLAGPTCGTGSPNGYMAAANLAVQPTSTPTQTGSAIPVGATPSSVAINTATGFAVVTNQGSGDISIINLASPGAPSALCTDGGSEPCTARAATAPISVAVDNLRNLALVANSGNATLAVVNLSTAQVTALLTFPSADVSGNPFALIPRAVGINPVSGRALVAFTSTASTGSNAGAILDMNQVQAASGAVTLPAAGANPILINSVNINNGLNTRIAVSPRLNWALATPGGAGALSIVDLGRQTVNQISGIGCVSGSSPPTVTVTTTIVNGLQVGQPVLISGVTPASFNGIFAVTAVNNTSFQYFAHAPCPSGAPSGSGGTASYSNPVASVGVDLNVRSVSINDETEKALLVDPTSSEPAFIFNILDQSSAPVNNLPASTSNITGAINPLTNDALVLNKGGQGFVIDPTVPTVICNTQPCSATFNTSTTPVDVAIDPVTNTAAILNQGGTVSLYSLGAFTSNPQIIQTSVAPIGSAQPTSSQVTLNSSLGSPATASDQTVTLIGHFDSSSVPQLDGDPSFFTSHTFVSSREITATLSGAKLAANGPRRYAVQAADSTTVTSNAARLPAIQAVSLITGCSNPAPQGVAIDSGVTSLGQIFSAAIVTEPGCNQVAMVSLSDSSGFTHGTGFGASPELAVQSNPQGVDVYPPAGLAVVANAGSSSVSIVDMANDGVPVTFNTDPVPDGIAVDLGTGKALVTANGASVVDTFAVSTTAQTPTNIGVQQSPSGVAIDPLRGVAVVANSASGSNNTSILNLSSNSTTFTTPAGSIFFPQGVAFDPISDTFMITSGSNNQVVLLNPVSDQTAAIRVGIDPSSIAYNAVSGTLVTANSLSSTVTMVDFLDQTVRAVFSLKSSSQFAVAIQPQTNLAVIADTADNQLLLVPLPN